MRKIKRETRHQDAWIILNLNIGENLNVKMLRNDKIDNNFAGVYSTMQTKEAKNNKIPVYDYKHSIEGLFILITIVIPLTSLQCIMVVLWVITCVFRAFSSKILFAWSFWIPCYKHLYLLFIIWFWRMQNFKKGPFLLLILYFFVLLQNICW